MSTKICVTGKNLVLHKAQNEMVRTDIVVTDAVVTEMVTTDNDCDKSIKSRTKYHMNLT